MDYAEKFPKQAFVELCRSPIRPIDGASTEDLCLLPLWDIPASCQAGVVFVADGRRETGEQSGAGPRFGFRSAFVRAIRFVLFVKFILILTVLKPPSQRW
jgi:hypothetical protein